MYVFQSIQESIQEYAAEKHKTGHWQISVCIVELANNPDDAGNWNLE